MTWISFSIGGLPRLANLGPDAEIYIGGMGDTDRSIDAKGVAPLATDLTLDEAKDTMEALTLLLAHNTNGVISMAAAIRRKPPTPIHDTTVDALVDTMNPNHPNPPPAPITTPA